MGMFDGLLTGPQGPAMLNPLSDRSPLLRGPQEAMYLGTQAQGIDQDALQRAQQAYAAHPDMTPVQKEGIRGATGWWQSPDDRWKTEISDADSSIVGNKIPADGTKTTIGAVLNHPELFKAYPFLADVPLKFAGGLGGATGETTPDGITLDPSALKSPDHFREILLHELQHKIQDQEGFGSGGSSTYMKRLAESQGRPIDETEAYRRYRSLLGEAEAFDTQSRRDMSPDQRLMQKPLDSQWNYTHGGYYVADQPRRPVPPPTPWRTQPFMMPPYGTP